MRPCRGPMTHQRWKEEPRGGRARSLRAHSVYLDVPWHRSVLHVGNRKHYKRKSRGIQIETQIIMILRRSPPSADIEGCDISVGWLGSSSVRCDSATYTTTSVHIACVGQARRSGFPVGGGATRAESGQEQRDPSSQAICNVY